MSQATQIRRLIIEMTIPEITHHLGSAMSCVEILDTLYADILKVDPKNSAWTKRDIFILSKGHAASALYATLHLKGFFNKKELLKFDQNACQLGLVSRLVSNKLKNLIEFLCSCLMAN